LFFGCPLPKLDRQDDIDFPTTYGQQSGAMFEFVLRLFRMIWLCTRGYQALVLENLALR
jgi:hypothetical protein